MEPSQTLRLTDHFRDLPDPRLGRLCHHELLDLIAIAICAAICGPSAFTEMADYAADHHDWLKTFLRLPHGAPSHDTFRKVLSALDPLAFQRCFPSWIEALSKATDLRHVAIDGKALRGSRDRAHGVAPLHLVSAWAAENTLTLGQGAVEGKSDEITAIPRLLEILDLSGAVVTIDAMGCQKAVASRVREAGADYVLAVKGNQPRLLDDLCAAVEAHLDGPGSSEDASLLRTEEVGHGRREVRTYTLVSESGPIRDRELWEDLRRVCRVVSERTADGETGMQVRYYIGGLEGGVADYARVIRGHWGIENGCHWVLDVTYRDDGSRNRADHGAENLAWLRRMALSVLKNHTGGKRGLKGKSAKALGNHDFLIELLAQVSGEKEDA